MRLRIFTLITCLMVNFALADDKLPEPLPAMNLKEGKLRVLSYNLYGGRNPDNAKDVSRLVKVMELLNADVIALQEVDIRTKRFDGRDLLKELEDALKMKGFFMETITLPGGHYGIAVLSRVKVNSRGGEELPRFEDREWRCIINVDCEMPNGAKFTFYSTHFDHTKEESNRKDQATAVAKLTPEFPALLLGDFNSRSDSETHRILNQVWKDTWNLSLHKTRASRESRIDFIFTNSETFKVLHTEEGANIFPDHPAWSKLIESASDHPPVIAEVEIRS